jgi:calcium uniporter protein, mitochondrial
MRRAQRVLLSTGLPLSKPRPQSPIISTFRSRPQAQYLPPFRLSNRTFSTTRIWRKDEYTDQAKALNQKGQDKHEAGFDNQIDGAIGQAKELQTRTPWHREGSDKPPVKRMRSAGAMTKGSLPLSSSWIRTISKADVCLL